MPRIKCPKCSKVETIFKSGFIRQKQRYFCKECNFNFTLNHENRKAKNKARRSYQTTIQDIAKAIGISATTVSRALHDHPDISRTTITAVKKVAAEMDYHPNLLARSFANKKTQTVGVIIPSLESTFFSSMLGGIQKVASLHGYKVIMCQSNENSQTEIDNVRVLMESRVDGLLICHSMENKSYDHIKLHSDRGIPIVNFYRISAETKTAKVIAKNTAGAELISQHLLDQGCERVAMILGPKSLLITIERLKGYLNVLAANNIQADQQLIAYTDYSYAAIISAIDGWLELPNPPEAIFCTSDLAAIYTIKYLKTKNVRVPADIAVAGFGNDLMGELIEPGLTTYDVRTSCIGETSMRLFLDQIDANQDDQVETKIVDGALVVRGSSLKMKG